MKLEILTRPMLYYGASRDQQHFPLAVQPVSQPQSYLISSVSARTSGRIYPRRIRPFQFARRISQQ